MVDKIDLKPFLKQKVQEWKRAKQKNPDMKSLEQVGAELLGVSLREDQQNERVVAKILFQLDSLGKKNRLERYVNQMSKEERKYVSLVGILEEFRPGNQES
jgi:hypothetical protein